MRFCSCEAFSRGRTSKPPNFRNFKTSVQTTRGIILRKTKLTETSLILSWLTEDHGRLKTVAKGARAAKSAFAGQIDLFYLCEISIRRSTRSDLHILAEARLKEPFVNIRQHYPRLLFAAYASELVELATEPEHPAPELFDLLHRALGYLDKTAPDRRALNFLEWEICRYSGVTPENAAHASRELRHHWGRLPESRQTLLEVL